MLSGESIKTLQALYQEIEKMKGNLSKKDEVIADINCSDEKVGHIEMASNENNDSYVTEAVESSKRDVINSELNEGMNMLEEVKMKNNELISHVMTLQGQYEEGRGMSTNATSPSPTNPNPEQGAAHSKETFTRKNGDKKANVSDKSREESGNVNVDDCCCKELSLKLDLLVAENMKYEMRIVELNKELSQHKSGCGCSDKSSKIDFLIDENMKYEKQIIKLSKEWNNLNQLSEDLKMKNDKLSTENERLKEENERCRLESDGITMYVGQDLQNRVLQLEIQKKKLEITNTAYKKQLMDKQTVIDELEATNDSSANSNKTKRPTSQDPRDPESQLQMEQLKEDTNTILKENESLRSTNAELKSEIEKIREDAERLKLENNTQKDCFFTKTLEIESILSENSQLRKDSINLHRPCNAKIDNLEEQVKGLREVNATVSEKMIHLKDKYESLKCKLKEEELNVSLDSQRSKLSDEDDTLKVSGMKGECIKLVYVLRRVKKDYSKLKSQLKAVEKEREFAKVENEKLKVEMKKLKASMEEMREEKVKVEEANIELTASLTLWKHTEAARSSANKILREKLKSRGRPFL